MSLPERLTQKLSASMTIGVLDGVIVGALVRHVMSALVGVPLWLMLMTAIAITTALFCTARFGVVISSLAAGTVLSLGFPSSLVPPSVHVLTHAPALVRGVDLFDALEKLDESPDELVGKRISVKGLWRSARSGAKAAVYQIVMACCAADAVDVGFDVVPRSTVRIPDASEVTVIGIASIVSESGDTRFELRAAQVKPR
jgi:hypothetical protein